MKKSLLPLAGITAAAMTLAAHGAVLISDDFESYSVGSSLGSAANWNIDNGAGAPTISNASDFGASNKFVNFNDANSSDFSSMVHTTKIDSGQTVTLSLDFIATDDQSINFGFSSSTTANQVLGNSLVARTSLTDGAISGTNSTSGFGSGFFSLNTAYELKMVLNDSGATVNYANRSLADNSYDVWIRDLNDTGSTYVGTGTFTTVAGGYYTAARSFNSPTPTYYIDNWVVEEGAIVSPIPEPRAALLGGLGLLALLRRRRQ
jgi:MYXO-CTERM domain-containing protein